MSETVTVACKLPQGFDLIVGDKTVRIDGLNKIVVIGATEAYTEVDKQHWDAWLAENKNKSWCTSQSIFAMPNAKEAKAKAKDLKGVKTGLEPVVPKEDSKE